MNQSAKRIASRKVPKELPVALEVTGALDLF